MNDQEEADLIARVAERVVKAGQPKGWQKFGFAVTPFLGVFWSFATVIVIPWSTWVTVSILTLQPNVPRVTHADVALADNALRDQMRAEMKQAFDALSGQISENTDLLNSINIRLARKGIE